MNRTKLIYAVAAVGIATVLTAGAVEIASAGTSSFQSKACVTFGTDGKTAAGNVMLYDWNDSACPPGTYTVKLAEPGPAPTVTVTATKTVTSSPSPSPSASSSASASASSTATGAAG